ncbi:MAG: (2Fe-2S)-binding protein [Chloroflexi bacterium]|nr:(2Fe-2S)-binding protein [Chloroflexota bacterium]
MPEDTGSASPEPSEVDSTSGEHIRPLATRRDFLVGAGAGAVVVGVVAGAGIAATRNSAPVQTVPTAPGQPAVAVAPPPAGQTQPQGTAQPQAAPQTNGQAPAGQLPPSMRHVTLNIDGVGREVTVDVRESLWETMTRGLNLSSSNLGCDRAQCGACTVLVDGRAVNGCTVLSARLGRGQQIMTVASLAKGAGVDGLHPIQRAFWGDGGFQCGICTRGFIMSTYALLQSNPNPNDDQIAEGLAGNICRCGEYSKIFTSVKTAAADMRGEQVQYTSNLNAFTAPIVQPAPSAASIPGTSKDFTFVTPLSTIEEFEPFAAPLRQKPGIIDVQGSVQDVTVKWDPSKIDEPGVRKMLSDAGHPVN